MIDDDRTGMSRRSLGLGALLGTVGLGATASAASATTAGGDCITGYGPDGHPNRPALRMGDAFLTSCVIRLDGDPADEHGWATRHINGSHWAFNVPGPPRLVATNMQRNGLHVGGMMHVPFQVHRPVAFSFAGPDEAFPSNEVDVGVSGGVSAANLVFWSRRESRYLNPLEEEDRRIIGGNSTNVWLAVISAGPSLN